jgi:hypothetical protein
LPPTNTNWPPKAKSRLPQGENKQIPKSLLHARRIHPYGTKNRMEHAMQVYKYRFLKRIIAFARDKLEERSIIARYGGRRWCDSTERALSNELMRRHSFKL